MNFLSKVKVFFALVSGGAEKGLVELGKHTETLVSVATTVETLTGNEELVELTQKAGQAVINISEAIQNDEAGVVEAVAEQISEVATSEGSEKVAKVAKKVSKVAKKVSKVTKTPKKEKV